MTSLRRAEPLRPSWLIVGAAGFAMAELAAGLVAGRFFDWGRAEALLFLAFRPWLVVAAALGVARFGWRSRAAFYALALVTAGLCESLLLLGLGADPWGEMLRGWAAGAALAIGVDLLVQLGRRFGGRLGPAAAAIAALALLATPGLPKPHEALVLGPTAPRPVAAKAELLLMTGLPLVWGETGPFDTTSRPAAAHRALQQEFAIRPIDHLDAGTLGDATLMLLAQPRALEPAELVALDAWVRRGGRVLILTDPDLRWPTRLPLGDLRRPPQTGLLAPLLGHWGLRLEASPGRRMRIEHLRDGGRVRRLVVVAPGRFAASGPLCRTSGSGLFASCEPGRGKALLVADADLLRDDLWAAPSPRGTERHARLADNPLLVASWLDRLAGIERERAARPVQWLAPNASRGSALAIAAAPILALLALALAIRRRSTDLSTALSRQNRSGI